MKKLLKGLLIAFGIFVALIIVVALVAGDEETTEPTPTESANDEQKADETVEEPEEAEPEVVEEPEEPIEEEAQKSVGIGETATIEDIGFTVLKANSTQTIDSDNQFIDPVITDNQFIVLDVAINNGQSEPIMTDSNFFSLVAADGTEYSPKNDGELIMVMPSEKMLFLEEINPGLKKEGMIVFEVGTDIDMSELTLKANAGFWGTKSVNIDLK